MKFSLLAGVVLIRMALSFTPHHHVQVKPPSTTVLFSDLDYEYIPPNPDASPDETPSPLSSVFPPGTPAGLRGEAARSALKSGRCIGWELSDEATLATGGILQIQGKGTRDFLNNKLTQDFPSSNVLGFREACLLDAKGRVVDKLQVVILDDGATAFVMTSPGHSIQQLSDRLEPFIFPMDQVTLTSYMNDQAFVFSLASVQWKDVHKVLTEQAFPEQKEFPTKANDATLFQLDENNRVLVIPSVGFPSQVAMGYTVVVFGSETAKTVGQRIWSSLVGDGNAEGPIAIGALEYETLRIEAGVPAYGKEMGEGIKTNPLELHLQKETVNLDKGCYLGQEGVASMVKNPRGPPRLLYSVVFQDEFNVYETQSRGDGSDIENLTLPPRVGKKLYALGSNEKLLVGTITSVAEAAGTGDRNIVGLALVRRADSILKQMEEMGIEIPVEMEEMVDEKEGSVMIKPPPLDPLDGIEVIIEGTFTVGNLRMIPSRRLRPGLSLYDEELRVTPFEKSDDAPTSSETTKRIEQREEKSIADMQADAKKAAEEAEAAAVEAKRKADKMEMLKKRAEEAMAKRKAKKKE